MWWFGAGVVGRGVGMGIGGSLWCVVAGRDCVMMNGFSMVVFREYEIWFNVT